MNPCREEGCPRVISYFQQPFQTKKVGNIKISFVNYSDSNMIYLKPDIVKYACNGALPLYDLIIGKQKLHDPGVVLKTKSP